MGKHLDCVIAWKRPDGGVSITHLHEDDMLPGETQDAFFERHKAKLLALPEFSGYEPINLKCSELPNTGNRNEWVIKNGKVEIDSSKVQEKAQKEADKSFRRKAILKRLGLSENDLEDLRLYRG